MLLVGLSGVGRPVLIRGDTVANLSFGHSFFRATPKFVAPQESLLLDMRPPPRSVEEYLYRLLIDSPAFNNWVKRVHARINGLPPPHLQRPHLELNVNNMQDFVPTRIQRVNAFRIIWVDEFKRAFGFGRR